ncbi:ER lumen retaining receptor protein [Rutstroemia sp. NJR-2017a WRK4]|nr:ER lumen retaining receptor protein [Rutstroemia sp. NJR-2017a WRK4]
MSSSWTPFRYAADSSHFLSKCILIYAIHRNSSAEGVSLITQVLYAVVFCTRYMDLFKGTHMTGTHMYWNVTLKIFYILSSLYIIFLMLRVYARTRERETAWKLGGICLVGSVALAPVLLIVENLVKDRKNWGPMEFLWIFSIILESTCILPQLLLLRQTSVPTVINSYYLVALGMYRFLYLLNWFERSLDINDRSLNWIAIIAGIIQTAFYIDFAWVYYSRQRVKLRNGGIVDSDDLGRGWLVGRVLGSKHIVASQDDDEDEDVEANPGQGARKAKNTKWGARGVSVSADDDLPDYEGQESGTVDAAGGNGDLDRDAKMKDPDELARILDDEGEESEEDGTLLPSGSGGPSAGNGAEWRK